jgi:hypothetical protein
MRKPGWISGDGIEKFYFRRKPDGWLFEMPFAWPRSAYLLSDTQKEPLATPLRGLWRLQMAILIFGVILITGTGEGIGWIVLAFEMIAVTRIYVASVIVPLLAGVPATSERIKRFDMKYAAELMPMAWIVSGIVLFLFLFAAAVATGISLKDPGAAAAAVVLGLFAVYFVALFAIKRRISRPLGEGP